jgi:hypothetical protein
MVPFAPGTADGLPMRREALRALAPAQSPSLMTCAETCERLYTELFESLAGMGFKACVAFGERLLDVSARAVAEVAATLLREKRLVHPGYVIAFRVSRVQPYAGSLRDLPCPEAADAARYAPRVFRDTLCAIPDLGALYAGSPLLVYYAFAVDCPEPGRVALGLGYDAPLKVWVDRQLCFLDEQGAPPASGTPLGGPKAELALPLERGRHDVLIALAPPRGQAAGIRVRLRQKNHGGSRNT